MRKVWECGGLGVGCGKAGGLFNETGSIAWCAEYPSVIGVRNGVRRRRRGGGGGGGRRYGGGRERKGKAKVGGRGKGKRRWEGEKKEESEGGREGREEVGRQGGREEGREEKSRPPPPPPPFTSRFLHLPFHFQLRFTRSVLNSTFGAPERSIKFFSYI